MSYFPNFLELQRSNNWTEKNECQMPRNTMNELIMNYLVTGNFLFHKYLQRRLYYLWLVATNLKSQQYCKTDLLKDHLDQSNFFEQNLLFIYFQKDSKKPQKSLRKKLI